MSDPTTQVQGTPTAGPGGFPEPPSPILETPTLTPEEWAACHADDKKAATLVAGILFTIFGIAVVLYGSVAIWTAINS